MTTKNRTTRSTERAQIRVTCIASFTTPDNDLVLAGTTGTLIAWTVENGDPHHHAAHAVVEVAWDAYMFNEIPEWPEDHDDAEYILSAATMRGENALYANVHIDNIRIVPS